MVTLPLSLPILRLPGREVTHYTEEWVASAVRSAAQRAGNPHSWFADDVAAGVFAHLRKSSRGSTVTLRDIHAKIVLALSTVGLDDIAAELVLPAPAYRVSLAPIASIYPYELGFFSALRSEIEPAICSGAPMVICSGINSAARILVGGRRWCPSCEKMRHEIVEFVSQTLEHLAPNLPQPPSLTFFQESPKAA